MIYIYIHTHTQDRIDLDIHLLFGVEKISIEPGWDKTFYHIL